MDVKHVARLANLTVTSGEENLFADQFGKTLKTIELINELDTSKVDPTYQVTGLVNVTRPDQVDTVRIIPQSEVLSQAHRVYKGYIVVPWVFDE